MTVVDFVTELLILIALKSVFYDSATTFVIRSVYDHEFVIIVRRLPMIMATTVLASYF